MIKRYILLTVAAVLTAIGASAALTSGYYKIRNTGYGRYMYEDFMSQTVSTSSTCGSTDFEKMWKVTVTGSAITIQNVYTGHYIKSQTSNSQQFPTGSTSSTITTTSSGEGYILLCGNYMHCASSQGYNVVGWWDNSSTYSIWAFESVSLTDADVEAIQAEYQSSASINTNYDTYNTALSKFFTDLSCSELNATYSNYSESELKSAMADAGLPESLQAVGVSVRYQWDDETDPEIVKQFRVQTYRPYTRAYYARNKLNATQLNDMCNPTGIYANSKKDLLVFVDGAVPSGCELRLAGATGNNTIDYTSGTTLHQGVNAIKAAADLTQFWIMYTYTSDTQVDMSTLAGLKIHIEGGNVLGYVNAQDKSESEINTEYKKILTHANTVISANGVDDGNIEFIVKGNRGVFYFPLDTYNHIWAGTNYTGSYSTYQIGKSIGFFDSVLKWEWSTMGFMKRVVDGECDPAKNSSTHENLTGGNSLYPTYYNNLALTLQNASGTNPYSTTGYTSMPGVGGVESSYNAERVNFDNWCVGHESGHNNQGLINLPSSTESSNNLFSNIIQYQWGYRMSRGASIANANSDFVSGTQFALRDIGQTHRMYWQLYLYYHMARNNTAFYPTLFNLLRSDGLNLNSGTCFTKFYEKACEAAGQDLTSFFTVWGFLQPFTSQEFGDYTTRTLTLSQSDIDAAKARVKAKVTAGTYKKDNLQIMLIEDRTALIKRWDPFATGSEYKVSTDGNSVTASSLASSYGTMGGVAGMTSGSQTSATGSFIYSIANGVLTLTGTAGGAGVIVYDASGNIIAYGNTTTITIPSSVSDYSQLTVRAVATDGTTVEVKSVVDGGTDAEKLTSLQELVASAQEILDMSDATGMKVGYYKPTFLTNLKSLVAQANTIISNKTTSSYTSMINSLTSEIASVKANADLTIKLVDGNSYSIRNKSYGRYASVSSSKLVTKSSSTLSDNEKWQFVPTGSGSYYIYNVGSKTYVSYSGTSSQLQANATTKGSTATSSTTDVAYTYNLVDIGNGSFALQANEAGGYKFWHCASNASYNIVGWMNDQDASRWYITCVEGEEENPLASAWAAALTTAKANYDASWKYAVGFTASKADYTTMANVYTQYKDISTQECTQAQLTALQNANTAYANAKTLTLEEDRAYMIVSARSGWNMGKAITASTSTNGGSDTVSPGWEAKDEADGDQMWWFEKSATGVYRIKSYSNGKYIASATTMTTAGTDITIANYNGNRGQYTLTVNGSTKPLHCRYQQDEYSSAPLTEWDAEDNNASLWYLVPMCKASVSSTTAKVTDYYTSAASVATIAALQAKAAGIAVTDMASVDLTGASAVDGNIAIESIQTAMNAKTANANTIYYVAKGTSVASLTSNVAVANGTTASAGYTCQKLVITDGKNLTVPVAFKANSVSYSRTMDSNAEWGTVCLPYAPVVAGNVEYYELTGYYDLKITVTKVDAPKANTPYLFRRTDAAAYTANASGAVDIPVTSSARYEKAATDKIDIKLVGIETTTDVSDSRSYCMGEADDTFHALSSSLKPFRCYLTMDDDTYPTELGVMLASDVPEETGLDIIRSQDGNTVVFDLSGRRLNDIREGINIVNGVKVIR